MVERTIKRFVLTHHKVYDTNGKVAIKGRTDFMTCYSRPVVETAETVDELVDYCIKNGIGIYALEENGNLTHLNETPFYELPLGRAKRLMMWQGKDLVCAYEFEREGKQ